MHNLTQKTAYTFTINALLIGTIACSPDSPPQPPTPSTPPQPADIEPTTIAPTQPPPAPQQIPIATANFIKPSSAELFTQSTLKPQPLLKGGHFTLRQSHTDKVLIGQANAPNTRPETWFVLDLNTQKRHNSFKRLQRPDLELGLAVTRAKETPELVHLLTGNVLKPSIALTDKRTVAKYSIFPGNPTFVTVRSEDNAFFVGVWNDLQSTQVVANLPLPFKPERTTRTNDGKAVTFSRNGGGVPAHITTDTQHCAKFRAPFDGTPGQCLEYGKPATGLPEVYSFDDGWFFWSGGYRNTPRVYRADGQDTQELTIEGCRTKFYAALATPPRALVGCRVTKEQGQTMLLWSPDKTWTWTEPADADSKPRTRTTIGLVNDPILKGVEWDLQRTTLSRWFDLERGVIVNSSELAPLKFSAQPNPTLALEPSQDATASTLYALDFASLTQTPLTTLKGCEGHKLVEVERNQTTIVLACQAQPDPDLFVFTHLWTAILDLETKRFWRTKLYPEALLDSKTLLVSKRTRAAAESVSTFSTLYRINL